MINKKTYVNEKRDKNANELFHSRQPISSDPSTQSSWLSHWNDLGMHCFPDLHANSLIKHPEAAKKKKLVN